MELKALIHHTCPYSRNLLEALEKHSLLASTEILDTARAPYLALREGALSVPVLKADGRVLLSGPVTGEQLDTTLSSFTADIPDRETLFRGFISAILDNSATASRVYLYEDWPSVFGNPEFLLTTADLDGVAVRDNDQLLAAMGVAVEERIDSFFIEKEYLFHRVLALNFLREIYWMRGSVPPMNELAVIYPVPVIAHWLFARSSLGRIGVPGSLNSDTLHSKAAALRDYLVQEGDSLSEKAISTA
jgi:predicted thioredoxin/glutaredoxin